MMIVRPLFIMLNLFFCISHNSYIFVEFGSCEKLEAEVKELKEKLLAESNRGMDLMNIQTKMEESFKDLIASMSHQTQQDKDLTNRLQKEVLLLICHSALFFLI